MTSRGPLDVLTPETAIGWAYAPNRAGGVMVQAVFCHEIIGDALASEHRSDLAAIGLAEGNCGFTIRFYRQGAPLYLPFVPIKVDGGDTELARTGQLGFAEFFSALYSAHPSVGRSRSVLGGLWTDRTDAAAILYRLRGGVASKAIKLRCVPARSMPVSQARNSPCPEMQEWHGDAAVTRAFNLKSVRNYGMAQLGRGAVNADQRSVDEVPLRRRRLINEDPADVEIERLTDIRGRSPDPIPDREQRCRR